MFDYFPALFEHFPLLMFRTTSTKRVTLPNSDAISITETTPNPAKQITSEEEGHDDGHNGHDVGDGDSEAVDVSG